MLLHQELGYALGVEHDAGGPAVVGGGNGDGDSDLLALGVRRADHRDRREGQA